MSKKKLAWTDVLALGPTRIAQTLGCPVTTASAWINQKPCRNGPPEWQRKWFLAAFVTSRKPRR